MQEVWVMWKSSVGGTWLYLIWGKSVIVTRLIINRSFVCLYASYQLFIFPSCLLTILRNLVLWHVAWINFITQMAHNVQQVILSIMMESIGLWRGNKLQLLCSCSPSILRLWAITQIERSPHCHIVLPSTIPTMDITMWMSTVIGFVNDSPLLFLNHLLLVHPQSLILRFQTMLKRLRKRSWSLPPFLENWCWKRLNWKMWNKKWKHWVFSLSSYFVLLWCFATRKRLD